MLQTENEVPILTASSGKVDQSISSTTDSELAQTIEKAKHTQAIWSRYTLAERQKICLKIADTLMEKALEVSLKIHKFNGKLVEEALIAEVYPTIAVFNYFAKNSPKTLQAKKVRISAVPFAKAQIQYDPLGVIGIISPWNYPFYLALTDVPAALMAGNTVVIKPSEHSVGIGKIVEELMADSDLPKEIRGGLVQCVYGYGELGQKLISSGVNKICFTGSTRTGKLVYQAAAKEMIPCMLELGGKDAAIILDDADIQKTVEGITWGAFVNQGQTCASVEKVYIPENRLEEFQTSFKAYFDGLDPEQFGTMNTLFQKELVQKQVDQAISLGAKVVSEKNIEESDNQYKLNPRILAGVPENCDLMTQETFGPVLPLIGYKEVEDVVREVNSSPYGLTASVWSNDFSRAEEIAKQLDTGAVTINDHMISAGMPEAPWGGHKLSGLGYSHTEESPRHFSKVKFIYHDRGLLKNKFWQYPFNSEKVELFIKLLKYQFSKELMTKAKATIQILPKFFCK